MAYQNSILAPRRGPLSFRGISRRALARLAATAVLLSGLLLGHSAVEGAKHPKAEKRINTASLVLSDTLNQFDGNTTWDLLDRAHCVGVFPDVIKGAFVFGGRYGKGVVSCRTGRQRWSAPATFRIEGANFGLQLGGSETDLVLVFLGNRSMEKLMRSKFTLGADGAAALGPIGRMGSASTDALLGTEILSYSRTRGVFAGISLDGATLRPAHDANHKLYGSYLDPREILRGDVQPTAAAQPLLDVLLNWSPDRRTRQPERTDSAFAAPE